VSGPIRVSAALALLVGGAAHGQDALWNYRSGEQTAEARKAAMENMPYNLKAGKLRFLLDANLGVTLNDNINLVEDGGDGDITIDPSLTLRSMLPLTQLNALVFDLGVGYSKYIDNSQYDRLVITPNTELAFDFFVKNVRLNVHDRFSYTEDPLEQGAISAEATFGGLSNSAGLGADWEVRPLRFSAGYDHYNFWSSDTTYEYLDRGTEYFVGRVGYEVSPTFSTGIESTAGLTSYDQNVLNDNTSFSIGAFAGWRPSRFLTITPRVGYTLYTFDSGGSIGTSEDVSTYYFDVNVSHTISSKVSHSIEGGREVELGVNSDAQLNWYARYNISLRVLRGMEVDLPLYYQFNENATGQAGEAYHRYGAGVRLRYPIARKILATAEYQFVHKDSDVVARDYSQNRLLLRATYRF
jgi:hypothetical protein